MSVIVVTSHSPISLFFESPSPNSLKKEKIFDIRSFEIGKNLPCTGVAPPTSS
jgi:hypothetical protein